MTRSAARRLHIPIDPPVQTTIAGYRVSFDGLNLIRLRVMVEYNVDPPIEPVPFDEYTPSRGMFGTRIMTLYVVDDTSPEPYPTFWEDLKWPNLGPGRTTTRLERRPPPTATHLVISVLPSDVGLRPDPATIARHAVVTFTVQLPDDHAAPWDPSIRAREAP